MNPLASGVRAVGWTSVGLGLLAAAAPRRVARAGGVADPSAAAVPVLVRLAAARQLSLGLAILSRRPVPVGRSARLFLPVTVVDAAAVLAGVRSGALERRSGAYSLLVLATNVAVAVAARED